MAFQSPFHAYPLRAYGIFIVGKKLGQHIRIAQVSQSLTARSKFNIIVRRRGGGVQEAVFDFAQEMFAKVAKTRKEMSGEARQTIEKRCELAADLAKGHDYSVHWCNLNPEADMLTRMTPGAVQISGSMKLEQKEEILLAFSKGEIKKLVTKPRITCFGLNWQHCNHTTFFPGFSHEQFYQAVRRFHRFGQKRSVYVDRVTSEGQIRTIQALDVKAAKADELYSMLNKNLHTNFDSKRSIPSQTIQLPSFL